MDLRRLILAGLALALLSAPAAAQQPPASTSGALSSAASVQLKVSGYASVAVQVTGTWAGTATFAGSVDGATYQAIACTQITTAASVTTTTGNGVWLCSVAGLADVQVGFANGGTYTSGTAAVSLQAAFAGGGSGGGGGGGAASSVTINDPSITTQKAAVNASGQLSITCANCSGSGASAVDESAFTQGTNSIAPIGGLFTTTPATLLTGQTGIAQMTADRALFVNLFKVGGSALALGQTTMASSLPVTVASNQAAIPVSGTVTANAGTGPSTAWKVDLSTTAANATAIKVDGSAVTQPISAVSLPLPTGAATAAKQPALGAAGTPSTDVLTVQGATAMTALKVDGSAVTQPISGSVTANLGTLNGAALDASVTGLEVAQGSTTTAQKGALVQGAVTTSAPLYTTAQTSALSLTTAGALRVDSSATTQPVSGTVTTNAGTGPATPWKVDLSGTGANATALKVDGSGVTQPISGTITANAGTGTFAVSGTVTSNQGTAAALTSGWPVVYGTVASVSAALSTVTCPGTGCVAVSGLASYASVFITVQGTWTGTSTVGFQISDDGTNFGSVMCVDLTSGVPNIQVTPTSGSVNTYGCSVPGGATDFRAKLNAAPATGSLTVKLTPAADPTGGIVAYTNALQAGTWTLAANQSVNVAQVNGATTVTAASGVQKVGVVGNAGASFDGATGAAVPANALQVGGTDGTNLVAQYLDPCQRGARTRVAINLAAGGQLITGTASKQTYLCDLDLVTATAQNIALVEGTGTTCATGTAGMAGGATAATGWNFAANGGLVKGNGVAWVYKTATLADNVCLLLSGTGQTSGSLSYVQYP